MKFRLAMNRLLLILGILFSSLFLGAKELPKQANPPRLVNDFAGVLSPFELDQLEKKLVAYDDSTSTQFAIVIERSLEGDDVFSYSQRLFTEWGIGRKGKNNGLLIYVAVEDRKIRIHTGYGMEATIPDALASRIIKQTIGREFKQNNYYLGLDLGTTQLMQAASGEFVNTEPKSGSRKQGSFIGTLVVIILVILVVIALSKKGRGGRGGGFGGGMMPPPFWGSFGSGGFSGGGGGDFGGFGGFGGGSSGGGGASGSW